MVVRRKRRDIIGIVTLSLAAVILIYHHSKANSLANFDLQKSNRARGRRVRPHGHVQSHNRDPKFEHQGKKGIDHQQRQHLTPQSRQQHEPQPDQKHEPQPDRNTEGNPAAEFNSKQVELGHSCWVADRNCSYQKGPGGILQCCCNVGVDPSPIKPYKSNDDLKFLCLPNFVVIGSQKSGSTALFGNFLAHPNFTAPAKKECHFFDKVKASDFEKKKTKTVVNYLRAFKLKNSQNLSQSITGDATPSYILNKMAPKHIAATLPHIKLLLIVRDPVLRAYSEWQMKHRRVIAQLDPARDKQEMHELGAIFHKCWFSCKSNPEEPEDKKHAQQALMTCMHRCDSIVNLDKHKNPKITWAAAHKKRLIHPLLSCYALVMRDLVNHGMTHAPTGLSAEIMAQCTRHEPAAVPYNGPNQHGPPKHDKNTKGPSKIFFANLTLSVKVPLMRFETVKPFAEATREEIRHIRSTCMEATNGESLVDQIQNDSLTDPFSFHFDYARCWPKGSDSNIAKDFIVRGLYLEQIKNYNKYFGDDQIMIIHDTELKYNTTRTMERVFKFVGLPPLPLSANTSSSDPFSQSNVAKLIDKTWPTFESNTGWHLESHYPPMPDDLFDELVDFYAPHNARLERYLNHSFNWSKPKNK